jgi:hypothetical protein
MVWLADIIRSMIRTQISLEPDQMDRLRDLAHARGVSIAALVREGVAAYLDAVDETDRWARARTVSGRFGWAGSARAHDDELADVLGQ